MCALHCSWSSASLTLPSSATSKKPSWMRLADRDSRIPKLVPDIQTRDTSKRARRIPSRLDDIEDINFSILRKKREGATCMVTIILFGALRV
ncbi:hypothetical protein SCLCIDRAFT_670584 [Scleroderma citrinum Foug A]|uniref:Uncharacterized protein n=1 Tax=Scleroderma citrinum Foug A TaxID=1036808 RepID=A0A0C3E778_9AGAM|nr:hypothetical protein SCLCIDRAFT_670584 [Scleroderma citrinum Foug A]